jgi:hypothetical protein
MNFQKLLYPLLVNAATIVFWTTFVDHDNTNYFWTNHALGIATAINVCQVMRNAFDMLEKELDEVIRDSENEKQNPRPRPITVSDLINCIRAIGKIDVKMIRTYNFAIPKKPELKPEPLMDNGWCNLDDANILCDKRNANNVNYYESDDEEEEDKLFRNKRVIHVKVEDAMDAIEQEVINEVANEVETEGSNEVETEGSNEVETEGSNEVETEVSNEVETEVSNEVDAEVLNEVDTEVSNAASNEIDTEVSHAVSNEVDNKIDTECANEVETNVETNVSNKVDTKDAEYVVVE